jgi:hypothetical protein
MSAARNSWLNSEGTDFSFHVVTPEIRSAFAERMFLTNLNHFFGNSGNASQNEIWRYAPSQLKAQTHTIGG